MNLLIITLIASCIAGVLYRLGGWAKGNRLYRVLGCPLVFLCLFWACFGFKIGFWGAYLITFGASAGAISAYWGLDEQKWGYWAHGLGVSLAVFPLAYVTGHWIGFTIRTFVATALITAWSEFVSWDTLEEWGRGFIFTVTLPLLLI